MKSKQLFCFTFAGGNASFYDVIASDLQGIDVVKLEYAGHGTRHEEPYYKSFADLAEDMYSEIRKSFLGWEYSLFGYSMGSISVVEVLRRILSDDHFPNPKHIFIAAHEPNAKAELKDFSSNELDDYVKQRTIMFGAVPEVLIDNNAFWRMYLPLYRADYSLIGNYRFDDLDIKTNIPATVFFSSTDTPAANMFLWKKYFIGECCFYEFDGNHFFIQEHHKEMARTIQEKLIGRISNDV